MKKARILIVEDEAIIAMEIENQLQSLGYIVTSIVDTGEKAIKKAEEDKPDIILMDIRIKGEMDGIEAAEEIRNRFGIPVIFSTAYLDEERIERAKITMPFGYVLKPVQERDLKVTIEMALYVSKVDAERRKTEEALRESEEKFRNLAENSLDTVWVMELDGSFIYISPSITELRGYTSEEAIAIPMEETMTPESLSHITRIFAEEKKKPMSECWAKRIIELKQYKKDGSVITTEVLVKGLRDAKGNVVRLQGSSRNITKRVRAEEIL